MANTVVNETREETLEEILDDTEAREADPAAATILRRYDSAALYEINRGG